MKHTPGPWNQAAIWALLRFGRKSTGGWCDEELLEDETLHMPDEDDATLIAAVPELLAALEKAIELAWRDHKTSEEQEFLEETERFIARVKSIGGS